MSDRCCQVLHYTWQRREAPELMSSGHGELIVILLTLEALQTLQAKITASDVTIVMQNSSSHTPACAHSGVECSPQLCTRGMPMEVSNSSAGDPHALTQAARPECVVSGPFTLFSTQLHCALPRSKLPDSWYFRPQNECVSKYASRCPTRLTSDIGTVIEKHTTRSS